MKISHYWVVFLLVATGCGSRTPPPEIGPGALEKATSKEEPLAEPVYNGKPLSHWVQALRSGDSRQLDALKAFRELGSKAAPAVPELILALKDPKLEVRQRIPEALGWIGPDARLAVPALLDACKESSVRLEAGLALSRIGLPAAPELFAALNSKDSGVREGAVLGLQAGSKIPGALPALVGVLKNDPDTRVRTSAAHSIGTHGAAAREAVSALLNALDDKIKHADERAGVAEALGAVAPDNPDVVQALIRAFRDPGVRQSTLRALARTGPDAKGVIEVMVEALKDENQFIRADADTALTKRGAAAVPAVLEAIKTDHAQVGAATVIGRIANEGKLGSSGKIAVPVLVAALKSKNAEIRMTMIQTLGHLGADAEEAVPVLLRIFETSQEIDRDDVIDALGKIGPVAKSAVPALLRRLEQVQQEPGGVNRQLQERWILQALERIDPAAAKKARMQNKSP